MSIYIITHKQYKQLINQPKNYKILLVGVDVGNVGLPSYLKDNSGINISNRNKSFCELTGEFWAWKNKSDKIVGFNHYRRYFVNENFKIHKILPPNFLREKKVERMLESYDIILPEKVDLGGKTVRQQFNYYHDSKAWDELRIIINKKYPEYMVDLNWVEEQKKEYCYNMFITKRKTFDSYFSWLFSILFILEKEIDISKYDNYNQRMFGFVAERLLNVWVHHNSLRVKECPVYFYSEKNIFQKVVTKFK